jgi:hypothetical protein
MCREGQTEQPRAYILADLDFFGDQVPFRTKAKRASEEVYMRGSVQGDGRSGEIPRDTFERSMKVLRQFWGNGVMRRETRMMQRMSE